MGLSLGRVGARVARDEGHVGQPQAPDRAHQGVPARAQEAQGRDGRRQGKGGKAGWAVVARRRGEQRARGDGTPDEQILAEIRETLRLPYGAKLKLIEDWEHITRERKLVPLPREPAIPTILEDFMAAKARRTSHERVYGEVCDGVKAYFNQALPTTLLYKYERRQYSEKKEQHKSRSRASTMARSIYCGSLSRCPSYWRAADAEGAYGRVNE